ncbi:hypothetical protein ACLOJK_027607 [Asimina triloba]
MIKGVVPFFLLGIVVDTLLLISIWGRCPFWPTAHCLGKRMGSAEMEDACCPRDLKLVLLLLPGSVLSTNVVCCKDGADGGADRMGFAALDRWTIAEDEDVELMYI